MAYITRKSRRSMTTFNFQEFLIFMVLAISQNKKIHRFDSNTLPTFTAGGVTSSPLWFIRDFHREQDSTLIWSPPNRTATGLEVHLRDIYYWNWTLSSGISKDPGSNTFTKSGADGFTGALGTPVGVTKIYVQGRPADVSSTICFSLQSGTAGLIFSNTDIEHALVFGQNGIGQIYEKGTGKAQANFRWEAGDRGLVELYDGVVRYYKISSSGEIILLRSVRSLLTGSITPGLTIYHNGGSVENVFVWQGEQAQATLDLYGVLDGEIQDWQNQATFESLSEKTMTKDKREDFTYFTDEKNLMTLSLNLSWREEEEYQAFKEFFQYHDYSRPFIFVDKARNKLLPRAHPGLADNEMFAQFVSSFKDNPLGAATYGVTVEIRQMIDPPNIVNIY